MSRKKCGATPGCQNIAVEGHRDMCRKHYKIWVGMNAPVDSAIVAAHIARLRDAGFGYASIATAAGVGITTVRKLSNCSRAFSYAPVAQAILAVSPERHRPLRMSPLGVTRRVRALLADGFTCDQIEYAIGDRQVNLWKYLRATAKWTTPATHDRIHATFVMLSAQPRPTGWVADRNRKVSAEKGWAPSFAWDIETIDDPNAKPIVEAIRRRPKLGQVLEDFRIEYLEMRDEFKLSDAVIAERLGITEDLLVKRLSRLHIPSQQSRAAS